jgi:hypothetical protein
MAKSNLISFRRSAPRFDASKSLAQHEQFVSTTADRRCQRGIIPLIAALMASRLTDRKNDRALPFNTPQHGNNHENN